MIYEEENMKQKVVYPTEQTPSYADWKLFGMGKELEEKVTGIEETVSEIPEIPTPVSPTDDGKVLTAVSGGLLRWNTPGGGVKITNQAIPPETTKAELYTILKNILDRYKGTNTIIVFVMPHGASGSDWSIEYSTSITFMKNVLVNNGSDYALAAIGVNYSVFGSNVNARTDVTSTGINIVPSGEITASDTGNIVTFIGCNITIYELD